MIKKWFRHVSVLIGIIFLIVLYRYLEQSKDIDLTGMIGTTGFFAIFLSSCFYFLSHFFRSIRIALMVGREDISLRSIIRTQFYTNGINLILPFKLGEIYRLYEFHKQIRKYEISVSSIAAEKSMDFLFLFIGLLISFFTIDANILNLDFTVIFCAITFAGLLFLSFILPTNIEAFNLFIAKRYSHPLVIKWLSFSSRILNIIRNARQLFREKTPTLLVLTFIIWSLEIFPFIFLYGSRLEMHHIFLLSFLVFLSIFIPAGSLGLGGIQLAFYCIHLLVRDFPYIELSLIYQIFIFLPAILISFVLLVRRKYLEQAKTLPSLPGSSLKNTWLALKGTLRKGTRITGLKSLFLK